MIIDMYGINIKLANKPNAHVLELGFSGMGKTAGLNEQIQTAIGSGLAVMCVDSAGSFTKTERNKLNVLDEKCVECVELSEKAYTVPFLTGNQSVDVKRLTKIFSEAFEVNGKMQKTILTQLFKNLWSEERIDFKDLFDVLEIMYLDALDDDIEKAKRISGIMDKLQPMEEFDFLNLVKMGKKVENQNEKKLMLLQLSNIPYETRLKYTELLLEVMWDLVQRREFGYQRIVLDEIQHISLKKTQALATMLREGRKYNLGLKLSTQFVDTKDKAKVETLMQAANILFFKPTSSSMRQVAQLIDAERYKEWQNILSQLQIGECILKGNYFANGNWKTCTDPILCKIKL